MVHKRITRTFAANTPERSCEKLKQCDVIQRQRDKNPFTRGESPLMSDLNYYIMHKDQDNQGGKH